MQVLILDGNQRSALAAVRSIGARGINVVVGDTTAPTLAGCSRYVSSQVVYPDPAMSPGRFLDWIREFSGDNQARVIMPMTDLTVMLLAPNQSLFRPSIVACGPHAAYERLTDKAQLVRSASALGIPVPATTLLHGMEELSEALGGLKFPLVLKPSRSRMLIEGRVESTSVFIAHSRHDAYSYLESQSWFGIYPCLAQEYIAGHGAGVFALYSGGAALAWFAHRRIREKPPEGGVSVLCESASLDPALKSLSQRLLDAATWHGPAMVEYRISPSGTAYLMEVNCRFWGSLQLAIDAGIDFPWLFYRVLCGLSVSCDMSYATGRRLRWLLGDVDNLGIQLKRIRGSPIAALRPIGQFLGSSADLGTRQEVFRWSDPKPAMHELATWVRLLT